MNRGSLEEKIDSVDEKITPPSEQYPPAPWAVIRDGKYRDASDLAAGVKRLYFPNDGADAYLDGHDLAADDPVYVGTVDEFETAIMRSLRDAYDHDRDVR